MKKRRSLITFNQTLTIDGGFFSEILRDRSIWPLIKLNLTSLILRASCVCTKEFQYWRQSPPPPPPLLLHLHRRHRLLFLLSGSHFHDGFPMKLKRAHNSLLTPLTTLDQFKRFNTSTSAGDYEPNSLQHLTRWMRLVFFFGNSGHKTAVSRQ